ncbi:kirola-like [Salvia divinorum]|uniref:Kirola-like n=1 Tax=Salvia divinorum TaxID=28513 RepID=A0ABD1IF62_SALDI
MLEYTHDGKKKRAKQVIQSIDEEKKLIQFKTLEGDIMELYKTFVVTAHVETTNDIDLVTWTLEYEMLNEDVGHPISLLSYFIDITKDIESHHFTKP